MPSLSFYIILRQFHPPLTLRTYICKIHNNFVLLSINNYRIRLNLLAETRFFYAKCPNLEYADIFLSEMLNIKFMKIR